MNKTSMAFGAGLAALSLGACSVSTSAPAGGSGNDDDIRIGAAIASSGFMTNTDQPAYDAVKLAVEQLNENGGIDGRKIRLIAKDTASDRAQSVQAAQEVIAEGADLMLVSCDYDYGAPAALVAQRKSMISFSLCAQSPKFGVQGVGDMAYSPEHATLESGAVMAEWAVKRGYGESVLLEDTSISYSKEVCASYKERYVDKGGKVVAKDVFQNSDASISTQISRIKSADVGAKTPIVVCSYNPGAASAIKQIRAAGLDNPIIAFNSIDGDYWLDSVPNLSDVYYDAAASVFGDDPEEKVNEFVAKYEETTGEAPVSSYALMGAALIEMYAQAVETAGTTDSEKVRDALDSFDGVETIVGPTTFTPELHIALDRPLAIMQIQKGTISHLEDLELSAPPTFSVE